MGRGGRGLLGFLGRGDFVGGAYLVYGLKEGLFS